MVVHCLCPGKTQSLFWAIAKERPVGFYHSGPRLRSSDLEISDLFRRFCDRPVMVIVDVRSTGGRGETGIPTDAYFAVEEIRDVSSPHLDLKILVH